MVESLLLRRSADKELGQHFLIEDSILDRTIELAGLDSEDHVLEVGPGPGTLTQLLLATGAKVTAIEIDSDTCEHLRDSLQHENLTLIEGDALKVK
ncbi:MAG: methyltransferase domain-containing protein, partial [Candidatus Poseidoniaceae archaeon]|nr:methyltransferase domain-containing protein [Candidatus Poseidoniaceae archaeon]